MTDIVPTDYAGPTYDRISGRSVGWCHAAPTTGDKPWHSRDGRAARRRDDETTDCSAVPPR